MASAASWAPSSWPCLAPPPSPAAWGISTSAASSSQLLASLYTILLSGIASYVILKVIDVTLGLRVSPEDENQGLDLAEHGEAAYND